MHHSDTFGTIALAAYRPRADLFIRQVRSLQAQTHTHFECLISVDGDPDDVRPLLTEAVGDDQRFRVLGFEERVGFYQNFARAMSAASSESRWIALSDQDDFWYPEKLERLLPHLDDVGLVSGQGRVVEIPSGRVIDESSARRTVSAEDLLLENQLTGSFMVFTREVAELSLPFPETDSPVAVHDQWIGMCAALTSGFVVVDEVLQDYHQHGGNVIGEMERQTGFSPRRTWKYLKDHSRRTIGSSSPRAVITTVYLTTIDWRRQLVDALAARVSSPEVDDLVRVVGSGHRFSDLFRFMRSAVGRGSMTWRAALGFIGSDALARWARPLVSHPRGRS